MTCKFFFFFCLLFEGSQIYLRWSLSETTIHGNIILPPMLSRQRSARTSLKKDVPLPQGNSIRKSRGDSTSTGSSSSSSSSGSTGNGGGGGSVVKTTHGSSGHELNLGGGSSFKLEGVPPLPPPPSGVPSGVPSGSVLVGMKNDIEQRVQLVESIQNTQRYDRSSYVFPRNLRKEVISMMMKKKVSTKISLLVSIQPIVPAVSLFCCLFVVSLCFFFLFFF